MTRGAGIYKCGVVDFENILSVLHTSPVNNLATLLSCLLKNENSCFALIIELENVCIGIVDQVRSMPIYFGAKRDIQLSNSSRDLLSGKSSTEFSRSGVDEFLLSGYVHGSNTLVDGISQLQGGQFIIID